MIGEHYALKSINSRDGNGLYKSHVRKHLCYDCEVHKVDIEKENNKLERRITEFFRTIIGKVVEFLLKFSRKERLPDWWRNRKIYQQQADIIRRTRSLEYVVS